MTTQLKQAIISEISDELTINRNNVLSVKIDPDKTNGLTVTQNGLYIDTSNSNGDIFTSTANGLVPASGNAGEDYFLCADQTWKKISSAGGGPLVVSTPMLTSSNKLAIGNTVLISVASKALLEGQHISYHSFYIADLGINVDEPADMSGTSTLSITLPNDVTPGTTYKLIATAHDDLSNESLPAEIQLVAQSMFINTPSVIYPEINDTSIAPNDIRIAGSDFSSYGVEDTHISSQFRILNSDLIVFHDSGEVTSNLTVYTVDLSSLSSTINYDSTYYIQIRYRGQQCGWSGWSENRSFTFFKKQFKAGNYLIKNENAFICTNNLNSVPSASILPKSCVPINNGNNKIGDTYYFVDLMYYRDDEGVCFIKFYKTKDFKTFISSELAPNPASYNNIKILNNNIYILQTKSIGSSLPVQTQYILYKINSNENEFSFNKVFDNTPSYYRNKYTPCNFTEYFDYLVLTSYYDTSSSSVNTNDRIYFINKLNYTITTYNDRCYELIQTYNNNGLFYYNFLNTIKACTNGDITSHLVGRISNPYPTNIICVNNYLYLLYILSDSVKVHILPSDTKGSSNLVNDSTVSITHNSENPVYVGGPTFTCITDNTGRLRYFTSDNSQTDTPNEIYEIVFDDNGTYNVYKTYDGFSLGSVYGDVSLFFIDNILHIQHLKVTYKFDDDHNEWVLKDDLYWSLIKQNIYSYPPYIINNISTNMKDINYNKIHPNHLVYFNNKLLTITYDKIGLGKLTTFDIDGACEILEDDGISPNDYEIYEIGNYVRSTTKVIDKNFNVESNDLSDGVEYPGPLRKVISSLYYGIKKKIEGSIISDLDTYTLDGFYFEYDNLPYYVKAKSSSTIEIPNIISDVPCALNTSSLSKLNFCISYNNDMIILCDSSSCYLISKSGDTYTYYRIIVPGTPDKLNNNIVNTYNCMYIKKIDDDIYLFHNYLQIIYKFDPTTKNFVDAGFPFYGEIYKLGED